MVNDTLANTTRAAHDVGLAAWLGGAMFGKFAHNPSLEKIASHSERGSVSNAAWNGYNAVNAAGLGAAALGWGAARLTEANPSNLTGTERSLSPRQGRPDGRGGAHGRRQRRAGRAPRQAGPRRRRAGAHGHQARGPNTAAKAARIQRSLGILGNLNIAAGVALVAVNGILAQINHSHPAKKRAFLRPRRSNA